MEKIIKEMKNAITKFILNSDNLEYDSDEDARIDEFWNAIGRDFFSDVSYERLQLKKSLINIDRIWKERATMEDLNEKRKRTVLESLKKRRQELKQERMELGEEAFLKKYPPMTIEEKRKKILNVVMKLKKEEV